MQETAALYGISEWTLYRALHQQMRPKALRRADSGQPRSVPTAEMERYCELIAAIKLRTSNKQGRCLSTGEAIRLLEEHGMKTPDGFVKPAKGLLKVSTVNRHLKRWGYDRPTLLRQPPAVRFQAEHSNDCWQFDLSPSDLKHINKPSWVREDGGNPQLMLYSVVDDRSGVAYMEYHCVYGEDVEAGLRFLFNAMSAKSVPGLGFQGIPQMIYTDNGPIARSQVFQKVMGYLGVELRTHIPAGKDGKRVTARSKGKVERPFRTVKEMYETLFHFHEPQTEEEANAGLRQYLLRYNDMDHRTEPHSRMQDWLENLPPIRHPRDVQLGAILHLRARTGAPEGRRRCAALPSTALPTKSIPISPERRSCSGGGCSTTSFTSSTATSDSGLTIPWAAPSCCTATGRIKKRGMSNAPSVSRHWRASSNWHARRFSEGRLPPDGQSHCRRRTSPSSRLPIPIRSRNLRSRTR